MANKYTGKGCQFLIKGATTYGPVANIQSIGKITESAAEVDVSTLDAGDYRDYIQGFKETGECPLALIFDPADASHDAETGVISQFHDGATLDCAIKIASDPEAFMTFSAFIRDFEWPEFNVDDPLVITPTFRLRTPVTLVSTLPTTVLTGGEGSRIGDMAKAA